MKMKKIGFLQLLSFLFFAGCTSVPSFNGKGDLCGLVVDEKNQPVSEFAVYCSDQKLIRKSTFTNDSGIFVFPDLSSGQFYISGKKNCFTELKTTSYQFYDRRKIICFQVYGVDAALDKVEQYVLLGDFFTAKEVLDSLCVEEATNEKKVVDYYTDYVSNKITERLYDEENSDA